MFRRRPLPPLPPGYAWLTRRESVQFWSVLAFAAAAWALAAWWFFG